MAKSTHDFGVKVSVKDRIVDVLGIEIYRLNLTISGIEAMHMIHKEQGGTENALDEIDLINRLFCVA